MKIFITALLLSLSSVALAQNFLVDAPNPYDSRANQNRAEHEEQERRDRERHEHEEHERREHSEYSNRERRH